MEFLAGMLCMAGVIGFWMIGAAFYEALQMKKRKELRIVTAEDDK